MAAAHPLDMHDPQGPDPSVQALFDKLKRETTALIAAGAHRTKGPQTEPDRSVWRILSFAGDDAVSDEQLGAAIPGYPVAELAAARARVADQVTHYDPAAPQPATLEELIAEPTVTMDEAISCGLMEARAERRCAPST
jgi:hypothetical protein